MKSKIKFSLSAIFAVLLLLANYSCSDDKDEVIPVKEGIAHAELIFTAVVGEDVEAHGDHFHGLAQGVEDKSVSVKFNDKGEAVCNGHLHLDPDVAYKIELKAWDYNQKEVQNEYISTKDVANQYKAFIVGDNFVLNAATADNSGAIFQPREMSFADGTAVTGQYETTGVLSYFILGDANTGEKNVAFIMRKLNAVDTKAKITRSDWNRSDYGTAFLGEDVLSLKFEIHAGAH